MTFHATHQGLQQNFILTVACEFFNDVAYTNQSEKELELVFSKVRVIKKLQFANTELGRQVVFWTYQMKHLVGNITFGGVTPLS